MAAGESLTPLAVGSPAPDFTLADALTGDAVTLSAIGGRGVIINFWSTECAWSRHYDDYLIERAAMWAAQGLALILIDPNINESIQEVRDMADAYSIPGPILIDEGCTVADAYGAQTTPHVFLVNPQGVVVYQGAVDDRSFRQQVATQNYLDSAVEALLKGDSISPAETPAYGCAIVRMV